MSTTTTDPEGLALEDLDGPVIYGLISHLDSKMFYVGQSVCVERRLSEHRIRFGRSITAVILQSEFDGETVNEAERKWIRKLQDDGFELRNSMFAGNQKLHVTEERGSINVRSADIKAWNIFSELTQANRMTVGYALEEAITNWSELAITSAYHAPSVNDLLRRKERLACLFRELTTPAVQQELNSSEPSE